MSRRHDIPFLVLAGFGLAVSGCAALPLATLGAIGGAAASAVSTGRDVYQHGKLDTAEMVDYGEAVSAARAAAADLGLTTDQLQLWEDGHCEFTCRDDRGATLKVKLERRASRLCWIRIDVGSFGSEVTARLFLARLRADLPHAPTTAPAPRLFPFDVRGSTFEVRR